MTRIESVIFLCDDSHEELWVLSVSCLWNRKREQQISDEAEVMFVWLRDVFGQILCRNVTPRVPDGSEIKRHLEVHQEINYLEFEGEKWSVEGGTRDHGTNLGGRRKMSGLGVNTCERVFLQCCCERLKFSSLRPHWLIHCHLRWVFR